jgi:hypothetical protein
LDLTVTWAIRFFLWQSSLFFIFLILFSNILILFLGNELEHLMLLSLLTMDDHS